MSQPSPEAGISAVQNGMYMMIEPSHQQGWKSAIRHAMYNMARL